METGCKPSRSLSTSILRGIPVRLTAARVIAVACWTQGKQEDGVDYWTKLRAWRWEERGGWSSELPSDSKAHSPHVLWSCNDNILSGSFQLKARIAFIISDFLEQKANKQTPNCSLKRSLILKQTIDILRDPALNKITNSDRLALRMRGFTPDGNWLCSFWQSGNELLEAVY